MQSSWAKGAFLLIEKLTLKSKSKNHPGRAGAKKITLVFLLALLAFIPNFHPTTSSREEMIRGEAARINHPLQDHEIYLPLIHKPTDFASETDWAQYQHDAFRSGYNPEPTPSHQFKEVWSKRFTDDGISSTAQPIIVGNKVFIGTERGAMYALDTASGKEVWVKQLEGGITHTAAATKSAVYVGTLAGHVYALDTNTGSEVWRFDTTGSFGSAALLVEENEIVYLANRTGNVHALDIQNGDEIWRTDLGYSILQSPTYGDGRIYVGAEDMRLHALDAQDGKVLWRTTQLYGRSFHDYAPVYAEGKVIVNVMPDLYGFSMEDLDLLKEANVDTSSSKDLAEAQEATLQWLGLHPEAQTTYAFDAATGERAYTPGVLYSVVNSGAQPPPVYGDEKLLTAFHVTSPMWLRKYWGPKDYGGLGRLDLGTGKIVERLSNIGEQGGTPGEFTVDETNNYAGAGDMLIGARCQTQPACTVFNNPSESCKVNKQSLYPFTNDLCTPGSSPIYAHGTMLYQAYNVLTAYQAGD